MAKKKNIQLGIDLQIQNYDNSIQELEKLEKVGGAVGKAAAKLKKEVIEAKNSLVSLGSTATPQELKKLIRVNADLATQMGEIAREADRVNLQLKATTKNYKEAEQAAKDYKKTLADLKAKQEETEKAAKTTKGSRATAKLNASDNSDYKASLDKRGVGKDAKDKNQAYWEAIKRDAKGTGKDAEAAKKILDEVNKEYAEAQQELKKLKADIADTTKKYDEMTAAAKKYREAKEGLEQRAAGLKTIASAAESATESINENNDALIKARDAAVKAGHGQIQLTKATDESSNSFTRAARSVFNYTVLYQGFKKILRESVRTIKEMDDAITGMTVVTNLSREEAWKQVESFEAIAKATSSTMTEIAGLTTEYLKQGRAMKDAKILAEETAKSAKIAGISTGEAVQYMTSTINGFNLAATDATRVSDVFANLAAASATDFEDLAIAVSKVSAQANLAGMSMEYTTALLAKGIETTQEAPESIGTALKTIVARMRELSSYGSVLEDGASVNKVERALASAGIELRDVNGEFRDLEDIFSELGPKWDYLNTMQQQAIAQAVAGTRQQSRFVAIMQDWGRTQELIAEANDSQGASAAQYYDYAQGIEAALTRMKTSWEGFVQGLANNKIIITGVNAVTKVIELINKVPAGLKLAIAAYAGIVLLNKVRENHEIKMKAYRQMAMTEEEKIKQAQGGALEQRLKENKALEEKNKLMQANLKMADELEKKAKESLQNSEKGKDFSAGTKLVEVQNKKAAAIEKHKNAGTESERMAAQIEINKLVKEEKALTAQIEQMRADKIIERLQAEKDLKKLETEIEVKANLKEIVDDIDRLDKEIITLDVQLQNTSDKKLQEQIKKDIESKEAERDSKVAEVGNATGMSPEEISNAQANAFDREVLSNSVKNEYLGLLEQEKQLKETINQTDVVGYQALNQAFYATDEQIAKLEELQSQGKLSEEQEARLNELYQQRKDIAELILANRQKVSELSGQEEELSATIEAKTSEKDAASAIVNDKTIADDDPAKEQALEKLIQLEEELQELQKKRVEITDQINELENGTVVLISDQILKTEELNKKKAEKETELGDVSTRLGELAVKAGAEEGEEPTKDTDISSLSTEEQAEYNSLLEQQKLIKEEIANLDMQSATVQGQVSEAMQQELTDLEQAKSYREEAANLEQQIAEQQQYQMTAEEAAMVARNEQEIERIKLIQKRLELERNALALEMKGMNQDSKEYKAKKKQLDNLNRTMSKNAKSINKLESKNQKIQNGTYNIYSKMADIVGNKLGVNIKGMVDNVKTVANFAKTLYTDLAKLIAPLFIQKKTEEEITEEKEEQNNEENKGVVSQVVDNALTTTEQKTEEEITDEKKEQTGEEGKTGIAKLANLVTTEGQEEAEEDVNKEKKKGFWESVKNAFANIATSAGQPYGMGLPFAIAAIGILALAGVGASLALGSAGAGGDAAKEESIAAKQNTNYEMKKSNASAKKALDEYATLKEKDVLTPEEEARLEELEEQMRGMDESFANLKGEALVKAVQGRVAAQETAIELNVNESFDTALSMKDIDSSTVARQAIADKMIQSQEKLIASNADLIDATDEEIAAIKDNASDMATELANNMEWNSFGTATDYGAWDYIGAGALTLLTAGLATPLIGAMAAEDIAAQEQAKAMENAIAEFERASVDMATTMELADDDLASQVAAFDSGLADLENSLSDNTDALKGFKEEALKTVKEQYGTVAYVSEMNKATGGELLKVVKSIQEKTGGAVSGDAVTKMADAVMGSTLDTKSKLEKLKEAESQKLGATSEGWAFFSGTNQDQNLRRVAKNLNMDNWETASINEIKSELAKQIKRNDDGSLMVDEDGNYAFKDVGNNFTGNNKELTEIFNNISNLSDELDSFADLTPQAAEKLQQWTDTIVDSNNLLMDTMSSIDEQLWSNEQLMAENTTEAQRETHNAGYAFMRAAQETANKIKDEGEALIAGLEKDKENATDATQKKAIEDAIDQVKKDMNTNAANLLKEAQSAVGYLADSDWLNRSETLSSKRDNVQDIKDAIFNKEQLTVEQEQRLFNEIIPDLQAVFPDYSTKELTDIFNNQGPKAIELLTDYLDNFNDNQNLIALNTIGVNRAMVEGAIDDLSKAGFDIAKLGVSYTTDEKGNKILNTESLGNVDQALLDQSIKEYKNTHGEDATIGWTDEFSSLLQSINTYFSHENQYKASVAELERESVLTSDEVKRANLEAKIAALTEDSTKHRLSVLEKEIELHQNLADELAVQLNKKKDIMTKDLAEMGLNFNDIFTIENGQVEIIESAYNKLSETAKEYITQNIDGLKEIVSATYDEVKTVIDAEQEKFDEIISLQETMIDAYKSKLEEEQEAVEETLEKRKELYQEYFDWLNNQEDEDERNNDIETLRQRIANLSGATDAASLKAYKDAVEELEDLEKESIQSEQEKIQEQILENLDKQSEQVEEYYDQQLEDNQTIIEAIRDMPQNMVLEMLRQADGYYNLTDKQKAQKDKEYQQLLDGWTTSNGTTLSNAIEEPEVEVETTTNTEGNTSHTTVHSIIHPKNKPRFERIPANADGGLVDYTGLAWVDGTLTKPEAFLNAEQTALFGKLGETLVAMSSQGVFGKLNDISASTINNNLTIENFDITINADMKDDQDLYETGNNLADVFFERIQASGIPVNIKK